MGMFDTFLGEIKCPYCGELHEFEEQTKSYDCTLDNFLIGDYVDKGNTNYIYEFKWWCDKDRSKLFDVGIAIRRGQIVKFLIADEIKTINIMNLDNIEDGLGRRLLYEKACREADGYPKEELNYELNPLPEGYKFIAFNVEWEIIKFYMQRKAFFVGDVEYFYEIKSKEHGLRIMKSTKVWGDGRIEIVSLDFANKYKELYFDENKLNK